MWKWASRVVCVCRFVVTVWSLRIRGRVCSKCVRSNVYSFTTKWNLELEMSPGKCASVSDTDAPGVILWSSLNIAILFWNSELVFSPLIIHHDDSCNTWDRSKAKTGCSQIDTVDAEVACLINHNDASACLLISHNDSLHSSYILALKWNLRTVCQKSSIQGRREGCEMCQTLLELCSYFDSEVITGHFILWNVRICLIIHRHYSDKAVAIFSLYFSSVNTCNITIMNLYR